MLRPENSDPADVNIEIMSIELCTIYYHIHVYRLTLLNATAGRRPQLDVVEFGDEVSMLKCGWLVGEPLQQLQLAGAGRKTVVQLDLVRQASSLSNTLQHRGVGAGQLGGGGDPPGQLELSYQVEMVELVSDMCEPTKQDNTGVRAVAAPTYTGAPTSYPLPSPTRNTEPSAQPNSSPPPRSTMTDSTISPAAPAPLPYFTNDTHQYILVVFSHH